MGKDYPETEPNWPYKRYEPSKKELVDAGEAPPAPPPKPKAKARAKPKAKA